MDGLLDDVVLLQGYILNAGQRTLDYNGGTGVAFEDWADEEEAGVIVHLLKPTAFAGSGVWELKPS